MRKSYEQDRQRGNFECTNPCQEKPDQIPTIILQSA